MIDATGEGLALIAGMSLIAAVSDEEDQTEKPSGSNRRHDRPGTLRNGSLALRRGSRRSQTDQRGETHDHARHQAPLRWRSSWGHLR